MDENKLENSSSSMKFGYKRISDAFARFTTQNGTDKVLEIEILGLSEASMEMIDQIKAEIKKENDMKDHVIF